MKTLKKRFKTISQIEFIAFNIIFNLLKPKLLLSHTNHEYLSTDTYTLPYHHWLPFVTSCYHNFGIETNFKKFDPKYHMLNKYIYNITCSNERVQVFT